VSVATNRAAHTADRASAPRGPYPDDRDRGARGPASSKVRGAPSPARPHSLASPPRPLIASMPSALAPAAGRDDRSARGPPPRWSPEHRAKAAVTDAEELLDVLRRHERDRHVSLSVREVSRPNRCSFRILIGANSTACAVPVGPSALPGCIRTSQ
jgi:hypothetical protein